MHSPPKRPRALYRKLSKAMTLVTLGISVFCGSPLSKGSLFSGNCYFRGANYVPYKIDGSERALRNNRRKIVKAAVKKRDIIRRSCCLIKSYGFCFQMALKEWIKHEVTFQTAS